LAPRDSPNTDGIDPGKNTDTVSGIGFKFQVIFQIIIYKIHSFMQIQVQMYA
jgi:hypothetical protein